MATNHIATAVAHLDAVAATRDTLADLYAQQRSNRGTGHEQSIAIKIAEAHQSIGYGLKAASNHAAVAQATALFAIADVLGQVIDRERGAIQVVNA